MTEKQLKQLLDSLTFEQKVGQIFQVPGPTFDENGVATGVSFIPWLDDECIKDCGSTLNVYDNKKLRTIQKNHLERNPIPLIFMADIINGYHINFPASIAQGCSFNPDYAQKAARITATEAAQHGVSVTFSPMVDVSRDARWGRCSEGYGESTLLNADFARANVIGYQGDSLDSDDTIASCVKHFVGYGSAIGGKDYYGSEMSKNTLYETYLPPFKAAVDAGARLVMPSFASINNEFCTINKELLVDLLRNEWGFDGTVISDYQAIHGCFKAGAAESLEDIAAYAIDAQVNIDMCDEAYPIHLKKAVEKGLVTMEQIDQMVMNMLKLKNDVGILDNPYKYIEKDSEDAVFEKEKHREFATDFVCQSSVLLKNEGAFPLKKGQKVAFIGPYLTESELTTAWSRVTPFRDKGISIKQALEETCDGFDYSFALGCELNEENIQTPQDEQLIAQAVELASKSDKVVLFIGEQYHMHGECRSRVDISIPKVQQKLIDEIYKVNKNVSAVMFSGRPNVITDIEPKLNAILHMWFPGTFGADAVAQMLVGRRGPSGKLSMCMPRHVGQLPIHHEVLRTTHPTGEGGPDAPYQTRYMDCFNSPLYPFGFGLSYTTFDYSEVSLSSETMGRDEKIIASVVVTNTGDVDAYETVQMYIGDMFSKHLVRPQRQLKGYKKVFINKGESKTVEFEITEEMLRFYDRDMNYISEAGEFVVNISSSSAHDNSKIFRLV